MIRLHQAALFQIPHMPCSSDCFYLALFDVIFRSSSYTRWLLNLWLGCSVKPQLLQRQHNQCAVGGWVQLVRTVTDFIFLTLESCLHLKFSAVTLVKRTTVVFMDGHWRTTAHHSKMVLVSVGPFQKYTLGPKRSPAKCLFSCWPQSYQYVCLLTLPYLSLDTEHRTLNADYC